MCSHPAWLLIDGPRLPLRYGSRPTQICRCGAWRRVGIDHAEWQRGQLLLVGEWVRFVNGEFYVEARAK